MNKKIKKIWYGWGFKYGHSSAATGFCGIYYWGETPPWINAIKTAVFRTRAEARNHRIQYLERTGRRKIVRVKVTIEEMPKCLKK